MRLEFENWVEETNLFSVAGYELIQEGVKCLKFGAYRSAFLMSYLAFKITLKDRLLVSRLIKEKENDAKWDNKIEGLKNEEEWEKHLDEIIFTSKEEFDVFKLNGDLKKEYTFWRKKRNDCAHAKKGTFSQSTVLMFWEFLQDHFVRFQVRGERNYIIDRVVEIVCSYEEVEKKKKDLNVVIKQMKSFAEEEKIEMIEEVKSKTDTEYKKRNQELESVKGLKYFWEMMFEQYQSEFIKISSESWQKFLYYYKRIPDILLTCLNYNPDFIKKELVGALIDNYFEKHWWHLIVDLLKYLKKEERDNIFSRMINRSWPMQAPIQQEEIEQLKEVGFYEKLREKIFAENKIGLNQNGIEYFNKNYDFIKQMLDNIEWDEKVYKNIEELMNWNGTPRIEGLGSDYYIFQEEHRPCLQASYAEKIEDYKKKQEEKEDE